MTGIIPIEYLWYIIGVVSVPVFILIYLKALKRNWADKARVSMRRKRFERMMKSQTGNKGSKRSTDRYDRSSRGSKSLKRTHAKAEPKEDSASGHWLRGVKLPPKREGPKHWLETMKPKRRRHWLENLRRR